MELQQMRSKIHTQNRRSTRQAEFLQNREDMMEKLLEQTPFSQEKLMNQNDEEAFVSLLRQYVDLGVMCRKRLDMPTPLASKIIYVLKNKHYNSEELFKIADIVNKICFIADLKFVVLLWERLDENCAFLMRDERVAFKFVQIFGNGILSIYETPQNLNIFLTKIFAHAMISQQNAEKSNVLWLLSIIAVYCPRDFALTFQNVELANQFISFRTRKDHLKQKSIVLYHLFQRYQYANAKTLEEFAGKVIEYQQTNFRIYHKIFSMFHPSIISCLNQFVKMENCCRLLFNFFRLVNQYNIQDEYCQKALIQVVVCFKELRSEKQLCKVLQRDFLPQILNVLGMLGSDKKNIGFILAEIVSQYTYDSEEKKRAQKFKLMFAERVYINESQDEGESQDYDDNDDD